MSYDFSTLSSADFEDLVRELVGRELGVTFEAFAAGPDGGMDGRHAAGDKATILQAKHFIGSPYSALKSAMKRERPSIDKLTPGRYIFATSRPLTPPNKSELAQIIGPKLKFESDIVGPGDLNALLRKYPDIERAHIKLWLSSTAVLDKLVHSGSHAFTAITKAEIEAKVRVYATNPSFTESLERLEKHHVLIISGPPGVGKTTLAEMISFSYIEDDWELVAIRSLDDGLAAIVDSKKQIFLFDDFLGKVALEARALASKDSDLVRFMTRVRASKNARFILTTRAYIFEQARRVSESLADQRLEASKYVLDVGTYTRRIKARILYNHLLVSGTPKDHIRTLIESGKIPNVVDHANYNPRVIEWMTDSIRTGSVTPESYPQVFLDALANPKQLWDIAFRTHISDNCRHLMFALFFCSQYGADLDDLRNSFEALHERLCQKYGIQRGPKDFEEAVKILEGGFITIAGDRISYVNPSLRDYLTEYIDNIELLREHALSAQRCNWAEALWRHVSGLPWSDNVKRDFVLSLEGIARRFTALRVMKPVPGEPGTRSIADESNADRLVQLLDWWLVSRAEVFSDLALEQAKHPVEGFNYWLDGTRLVEIVRKLRSGDDYPGLPCTAELAQEIDIKLIELLGNWMTIDALEDIYDRIEGAADQMTAEVQAAAKEAIQRMVEEVDYYIDYEDSEYSLADNMKSLEKLAESAEVNANTIESAIKIIKNRISDLAHTPAEEGPDIFGPRRAPEKFDDDDLRNLFAPLLED